MFVDRNSTNRYLVLVPLRYAHLFAPDDLLKRFAITLGYFRHCFVDRNSCLLIEIRSYTFGPAAFKINFCQQADGLSDNQCKVFHALPFFSLLMADFVCVLCLSLLVYEE